jgi:ParB/RepB/Spo0J family partition protein
MGDTLSTPAGLQRLTQYDAYSIPVKDIFYDSSFNCRGAFTLLSVKDLADSISANGLKFPVYVQPWGKDGYPYRLLAGHRRFVSVTDVLQWIEIPAVIQYELSEHQARLLNFTENLERKDLNPLEEAQALNKLYPETVSLRVVAKELKRSEGWVCDRRRLLKFPENVQRLIASGLIGLCHVKALIKLSPDKQLEAAQKIIDAKRQYGKSAPLNHLDPSFKRSFRYRKSKAAINKMVAKMLSKGITGLAPRMGAWCAGYITDKELNEDIKEALKHDDVS